MMSREIVLTRWQEKAAYSLNHLLNNGPGAILRGECGLGKTYIAGKLVLIRGLKSVLWVAPAFALPDLKEKVTELGLGVEDRITFMSYNVFREGNVNLNDHDFYIFDECHTLRHWKAAVTRQFSRVASRRPHLSISATPTIQHELDFLYVLRRAGAFHGMSIPEIKIKFFQAEPSRFHEGLNTYDLVRKDEFYSEVNKKVYDLRWADVVDDAPKIIPTILPLPIVCTPFKSLKEETKASVIDGVRKVSAGCKHILKFTEDNPNCLILTKYHATAREIERMLTKNKVKSYLGLSAKAVGKICGQFELGEYSGPIVTTLGLTRSSFDLNSVSNILIVESSYSYNLDIQSIMRCRRLGKTEDVKVSYLAFRDDRAVRKVLNRLNLNQVSNKTTHSKFGPSSLSLLKTCPGAYWMDDTSSFIYAGHAWLGKQHHHDVETFIKDDELPIPKGNTEKVIAWGRQLKAEGWEVHSELWMEDPSIRHDFNGTADIVAVKGDELIVGDYKNGNVKVNVNNNLQLLSYVLMAENTYKTNFNKIIIVIWQKNEYNECIITRNRLNKAANEVRALSNNVHAAKQNPTRYLDEFCTNPFCRAKTTHERKRLEYQEKLKNK